MQEAFPWVCLFGQENSCTEVGALVGQELYWYGNGTVNNLLLLFKKIVLSVHVYIYCQK